MTIREDIGAMQRLMAESARLFERMNNALGPIPDPENAEWIRDEVMSRLFDVESNIREIRAIYKNVHDYCDREGEITLARSERAPDDLLSRYEDGEY